MKTYEEILDSVTADDSFRRYVEGRYSGPAEEYRLHKQFTARMEAVLTAMDPQCYLSVIRYDDSLHESLSGSYHNKFPDSLQVTSMGTNFQLVNRRRLAGRDWFDDIYDSPALTRGLWKQVEEDTAANSITLFHELESLDLLTIPPQKIALIELTVPLDHLFSLEADTDFSEPVCYAVFSREGTLLFADDMLPLDELQSVYEQNEEGQIYLGERLYLCKSIPDTELVLISAVAIRSLQAPAYSILRVILLAVAICSVLVLVTSYIIAQTISSRITALCDSMMQLQQGELGTQLPMDGGTDEIGYLIQNFNQMSERIKTLVEDVYLANLEKKEADLRALQAQINPHFLYNSLATIIRLSELDRREDINTLVRALVVFYRMSLNRSGGTIPLREEFEQIRAYLCIYRIRMGEYFTDCVELDEQLYETPVLPLTIQPFVENIFHHALQDNGSIVTIYISAHRDGNCVQIVVEDDGRGMDAQQIESLFERPKKDSSNGYGAYNVNERIKLYFGKEYGVSVDSSPQKGTKVIIRIPYSI